MLVRNLLAMRRREIVPRLAGVAFDEAHAMDSGLLTANWRMGDGASLQLKANLSNRAMADQQRATTGAIIWGNEADEIAPWSVLWRVSSPNT